MMRSRPTAAALAAVLCFLLLIFGLHESDRTQQRSDGANTDLSFGPDPEEPVRDDTTAGRPSLQPAERESLAEISTHRESLPADAARLARSADSSDENRAEALLALAGMRGRRGEAIDVAIQMLAERRPGDLRSAAYRVLRDLVRPSDRWARRRLIELTWPTEYGNGLRDYCLIVTSTDKERERMIPIWSRHLDSARSDMRILMIECSVCFAETRSLLAALVRHFADPDIYVRRLAFQQLEGWNEFRAERLQTLREQLSAKDATTVVYAAKALLTIVGHDDHATRALSEVVEAGTGSPLWARMEAVSAIPLATRDRWAQEAVLAAAFAQEPDVGWRATLVFMSARPPYSERVTEAMSRRLCPPRGEPVGAVAPSESEAEAKLRREMLVALAKSRMRTDRLKSILDYYLKSANPAEMAGAIEAAVARKIPVMLSRKNLHVALVGDANPHAKADLLGWSRRVSVVD